MQINSATLLASQQTTIQAPAKPAPGFAAALQESGGFEPLALKQMACTDESPAAAPAPAKPARPGSLLDIKV